MGPVVVVVAIGGVFAAPTITKAKIQMIKRQINRHQEDIDKFKALEDLLQNFNVENILKKLEKLNKDGFLTLKSFFIQIEQQLKILKKARKNEFQQDKMSDLLSWVCHLGNIGIQLISLAPLFSEAPPVAVALAAIGGILSIIFNCIQIFTDIKQIQELEEKREEMIKYFSKGGEFEKNQLKLLHSSCEIVKNIYLCSLYSKQLFEQYFARLQLLSRGEAEGSTLLGFKEFDDIIKMNPFTWEFQKMLKEQYVHINKIVKSESGLSQKVASVYKILDFCIKKEGIIRKLTQLEKALELLGEKGSIIDQINERFELYQKINSVRGRVEDRFKERLSTLDAERKKQDGDLLDFMNMFLRNLPQKKLRAAQIVSFFTDQFYGDDPDGKTVYSYSLKELAKKTYELDKIKVVSENHFYLPEPKSKEEFKFWIANKNALIEMFKKAKKGLKIAAFKSMFMRMNQQANKEEDIMELKVFVGITLEIEKQEDVQIFERSFEELADVRWGEAAQLFQEEWVTIFPTFPGVNKTIPEGTLFDGAENAIQIKSLPGFKPVQLPKAELFQGADKNLSFGSVMTKQMPKQFMFPGAQNALKIEDYKSTGVVKLSLPKKCYQMNDLQKQLMMLSVTFQKLGVSILSQVVVNEDLGDLVEEVCLLVNGRAYPERLRMFQVEKKGILYEAKIEWSQETLIKEHFGKVLKGRLAKEPGEYSSKDQIFKVHQIQKNSTICWSLEE